MFYGEYEHTLDKKGRLIIPSKFREIFNDRKFYITKGLDRCLFLFTEEEWQSQEDKFKGMSFTKPDARRFNRMFFGGAFEAVCDKQGRVVMPQYLKEHSQIKNTVVLVGVSNRIEIWAKEIWDDYKEKSQAIFEETAENLISLDPSSI